MGSPQGSLAVVAGRATATNTALAQAFEQAGVEAAVLTGEEACDRLGPGDVARPARALTSSGYAQGDEEEAEEAAALAAGARP